MCEYVYKMRVCMCEYVYIRSDSIVAIGEEKNISAENACTYV